MSFDLRALVALQTVAVVAWAAGAIAHTPWAALAAAIVLAAALALFLPRRARTVTPERSELSMLREIAHAVATEDDPRPSVVEGVAELTGAAFAALCELAGEELEVTAATKTGFVGRRLVRGRDPSGAAAALARRAPVFVARGRGNLEINQPLMHATGASSILFQPVAVDGDLRAVLVVAWAEELDGLASAQADLVALAADEVGVALQRLAAVRRLEDAALTDPLTGVANRRAFEQALASTLARASRGDRVALALLDLNGFKLVNDLEGHEAGDNLLRAAATAWTAELRSEDVLARIGGDEFAVLLPDCSAENAERIAHRLAACCPNQAGCGVGVAMWDGEEGGSSLLKRADEALYADKARHGRHRLSDPRRLAALEATGVVTGPSDPELQTLAETAAALLQVPVVAVSLVDDERQHFVAQCGIEGWAERGTPLSHSFCQHAVATGRPLIVEDARAHPAVARNLAVDELDVVAYAGIPLIDGRGHTLGSLCAIDSRPRRWEADDVAVLRSLARRAAERIAA